MSQHPIDEVFRRKLEGHESDLPMHLWAQIEQRRNWKHVVLNQLRLRWFPLSAGALFTSIALAGLFHFALQAPEIKSLPIPIPQNNSNTIIEEMLPTAEAQVPVAEISNQVPSLEDTQLQQSLAPAAVLLTHSDDYEENQDYIAAEREKVEPALVAEETSAAPNALASLAFLELPNPLLKVDQEDGLFGNDPECAKFSKGHIRIYADILASPDFTFRKLAPKNPVHSEYAESRDLTESPEYNFSTGLRFSAVSGFGLALRTGVNYSEISEKFEYFNGSAVNVTIDYTYGPNGEIISADTVITTGQRFKTTFNKYRTLDIPILLGYEVNYKKFVFTINGGAYLNLIFEQKGDFLSPVDNQPVNFSSSNPNAYPAFKDKLDLGWYGSVGIHYKIKPRLQLIVEPHFKLYPKSITQDNYILDQKYLTTGVFFGIRHGI